MADADTEKKKAATDVEPVAPAKQKGNMLLYIIIPIMLILGVVGGIFLAPMFHKKEETETKDGKAAAAEYENSEENKKKKEALDPKNIVFVTIPDVLVNLKSSKQRPVFLKVSIVLEVHEAHLKEIIENLRPKIIDQLQTFLRDLETADVTGSANLQRLRQELLVRINNITSPYKIQDVLIKDFLVQ